MDKAERTTASDLVYRPIHALAPLIKAGQLSPVDLTEVHLKRIGALNPKLHAFADLWADEARAVATTQAKLIRAGGYLGPLHGIPIALKDMIEVAGKRTTGGAGIWKDRYSSGTATVYERLVAAGMNVFGKLNLVEFSCTAWGINMAMGTPRNPWDMKDHRVPGGSSSGSGVAVASGLVPAAIGSDTGGSIRVPAALNGTVGLKVTFGRVSAKNVVHIVPSLDTLGPLTLSVEDAALILQAITTDETCDDPIPTLRKPIKGMRLGLLARDQMGEGDPEVFAAVQTAAKVLEAQGAHIEEVRAPRTPPDYAASMAKVFVAEAYAYLREVVDRGHFTADEAIAGRILQGKAMSAADYINAVEEQRRDRAAFAPWLADYDAIILPTSAIAAVKVADCDRFNPIMALLTRWVNHLGLCALAVPCGFTRSGLPISLQIVGAPFDESRILRIGWTYEQATDWHKKHPSL